MKIDRRTFTNGLAAFGAAGIVGLPGFANATPIAGFEPEPWFAPTTGDLRKDLAAADASGKYLALLWEQKGCQYCHRLHTVNFQFDEITDLGKKHFHTFQMDLWGKRPFVDFDGKTRSEADIAKARGVRATPVILFFDGAGKEVFRMPGYAEPAVQFAIYRFVAEKGYADGSFLDWINKQS